MCITSLIILTFAVISLALGAFLLMVPLGITILSTTAVTIGVISVILIIRSRMNRLNRPDDRFHVAFFHPNCMAGGGGEKVLWHSIKSLEEKIKNIHITVLAASSCPDELEVKTHINDQFGIKIECPIEIVRILTHGLLKAERYKFAAILGQSIGSMVAAAEGSFRISNVDALIDTAGYAFTYPIFRFLGGIHYIIAYVHYPTINDSIKRDHHSKLKDTYYSGLSFVYKQCGRLCTFVVANSTWTKRHIENQWDRHAILIYPPCDGSPIQEEERNVERFIPPVIVSVAQFRQEKNLAMQIEIIDELFSRYPEFRGKVRLLMIGGCRDSKDRKRVADLIGIAFSKHISFEVTKNPVEDLERDTDTTLWFACGISANALKQSLIRSSIGIHTMIDEHFGIGEFASILKYILSWILITLLTTAIVESMNAGLIMVAHKSAGPLEDIIAPMKTSSRCGYCAASVDEYVNKISNILKMDNTSKETIRDEARKRARMFDSSEFRAKFFNYVILPIIE
ncbi:hypothetical protein ACOME3_004584 [Neoechinorhynchus agilis]